MRFQAANALLIALDRLQLQPNVLVFCTSNVIKAVVRNPNDCAAYERYISIAG